MSNKKSLKVSHKFKVIIDFPKKGIKALFNWFPKRIRFPKKVFPRTFKGLTEVPKITQADLRCPQGFLGASQDPFRKLSKSNLKYAPRITPFGGQDDCWKSFFNAGNL